MSRLTRMRWAAGVLLVAGLLAARGLPGGDPVGADALWDWARQEGGADLTHPAYLDAARELARLRPWQAGFRASRERLDAITEARRSALLEP